MPKLQYRNPVKKIQITEKMKENLQQLKQDLVETPVSKHKHKQLSRELKDIEKRGFT